MLNGEGLESESKSKSTGDGDDSGGEKGKQV